MAFLDDLANAQGIVNDRTAGTGGYATGTAEYYQNQADQRRLGLLDALRKAAADPTFANQLTAAGDSQLGVAKNQLNLSFQGADSANLSGAAARGLLGSSTARTARANAVANRDSGITDAATAITDWKDQAQQAQQIQLYDYLDKVINPTRSEEALKTISLGGVSFDNQLSNAMTGVQNQYRSGLSEALGSVLSNGVAPTISSGFRYADRGNQAAERANVSSGSNLYSTDRTFWNW